MITGLYDDNRVIILLFNAERCISLLSWLCCCARWISYSYCDENPATSGPVTYSPPADDDFRTFGNRETCRWPGTQDLPETSNHNDGGVAGCIILLLFTRFFLCTPRPAHHLRVAATRAELGALSAAWELSRVNVQFPRRTTTTTTTFEYGRSSSSSCEKYGTQDEKRTDATTTATGLWCKNCESL